MPGLTYRFDNFSLDLHSRTLWRDGRLIKLTAKQFDLLAILVENDGRAVTREQIVQKLWGQATDREQSTVPKHIGAVRKQIGDAPDRQPYIRTLSGVGYYFAGKTETEPEGSEPESQAIVAGSKDAESTSHIEKLLLLLRRFEVVKLALWSGMIVAVTGVCGYVLEHKAKMEDRSGRASVAVLPFQSQVGDTDKKWLATAVSEMLRTELLANGQARLISGEDIARLVSELTIPATATLSSDTLVRIRRRTDADYVVGGSFTVVPGTDECRIDVEIQDARSNKIVASGSVSGPQSDLFNLVAQSGATLKSVLNKSSSPTGPANPKTSLPSDLLAIQLMAQGIEELRNSNPLAAREILKHAASVDTRSALIRSSLAEAWARSGYEKQAQKEACTALELPQPQSREMQLLLEARCRELSRDWTRAVEVYQSLWTVFPDDLEHGLRLAHAQTSAGRPRDAKRTIVQIRARYKPQNDPRIDLAEAEVAETLGDFKSELQMSLVAERNALGRSNRLLAARAKLKGCWAQDYLGHRNEALQLARSARGTFADLHDLGNEAIAIKNIADVLDDAGKHAEAIPVYEEALSAFREIGSNTGRTLTLNNMAYAVKDTGDLSRAAELFSESVEVAGNIEDDQREAQALNGLAGVRWRLGNLSGAEVGYIQSLAHFQKAGDKNRTATVLGNLGSVLEDEGRLLEAERRFESSLDLARETGDQTSQARTIGNQGELYIKFGRLSEANKKFNEQLAIGEKMGEQKQRAYAMFGLGEVRFSQGDLQGARQQFEASLGIRRNEGEQGLAAESRFALAKVKVEDKEASAWRDAEVAASTFQLEGEVDQQAIVIAFSLRNSRASKGDHDLTFSKLERLLPHLTSPDVRANVLLEMAGYSYAHGKKQEALILLNSAMQNAKESQDVQMQMNASVTRASFQTNSVLRARDLEKVKERAIDQCFGLIARKADLMKAQAGRGTLLRPR